MIPLIIGISFLLFAIMDLTPGDPARVLLGEFASQEEVDALREKMGLNENFFVRYGNYLFKAVQGDFGTSYNTNIPCVEEIRDRFPSTLEIAALAMFFSSAIGIPIGIVSAVKQYSLVDFASMISALVLTSVPAFWLGLMMILLFSLKLGWLPSVGSTTWKHFLMPSIALAASHMATLIRMTRSTMLEVVRQDYIRTAKSKGGSPLHVIFKHAMRNTMLPVITVIGINFGLLLGGALIIENVFGISGLGTLMVMSVKSKDAPMLIASVLFASTIGGLVNLMVDILYAYIDPRVKMQYMKK
jgi:peptide/nickel transport system permease protein